MSFPEVKRGRQVQLGVKCRKVMSSWVPVNIHHKGSEPQPDPGQWRAGWQVRPSEGLATPHPGAESSLLLADAWVGVGTQLLAQAGLIKKTKNSHHQGQGSGQGCLPAAQAGQGSLALILSF